MATQVQLRRGTATENNSFTGAQGELTFDTTNKRVRIHDGATAGGFELNTKNSSGDTLFADNEKAIFGAGSDLQIYHNGTNQDRIESSSAFLILEGGNIILRNNGGTEDYAKFFGDGAVELYSDNALKLATTSTGVDITGVITTDGMTTSGNVGIGTSSPNVYTGYTSLTLNHATNGGIIDIERNGTLVGEMFTTDANTFSLAAVGAKAMNFSTNSAERMRIDSSGNVGIGVSDPDAKVEIKGTGGGTGLALKTTDASSNETFYVNDGGKAGVRYGPLVVGIPSATTHASGALFQVEETGLFTVLSSGNVGVGLTAPTGILSISGADTTSRPQLRFMSSVGTGLADAALSTTDDSGGTSLLIGSNLYYSDGSITRFSTSRSGAAIDFGYTGSMKFYTGSGNTAPDQKMTLDSNGDVMVGKTSSDNTTQGIKLDGSGYASFTIPNDFPIIANRLSSDGDIAVFRKDNSTVGSIGTEGGNLIVQGNPLTGKTGIKFGGAEWVPQDAGADSDGGVDLGLNTARFKDIYATNGTIQTSDRNEKQDIAELTDAEQRVAVAAKGLLRKFRWRDSVEAKGDEARTHFGIIAQDLQAAFAAEGLDAGDYAMFISGTWTDEETGEERTRMGVRYSELLAFIIAAI